MDSELAVVSADSRDFWWEIYCTPRLPNTVAKLRAPYSIRHTSRHHAIAAGTAQSQVGFMGQLCTTTTVSTATLHHKCVWPNKNGQLGHQFSPLWPFRIATVCILLGYSIGGFTPHREEDSVERCCDVADSTNQAMASARMESLRDRGPVGGRSQNRAQIRRTTGFFPTDFRQTSAGVQTGALSGHH